MVGTWLKILAVWTLGLVYQILQIEENIQSLFINKDQTKLYKGI